MSTVELKSPPPPRPLDPFRRAVLRGLGVLIPPLLTIVIFLWVGSTVKVYLLDPLENLARGVLEYQYAKRIVPASRVPRNQVSDGKVELDGVLYQQLADGRFVPVEDYEYVRDALEPAPMPENATILYRNLIERKFLPPEVVIPLFLCGFLLLLYLLGRFLAAGIGRLFWAQFEGVINRLPLVRNVYSAVKQVSDFMFSERDVQFNRVVAIEYPRKGIWMMAFVTGEGLLDVRCAANEPILTVLVPTSPMPFTGFTTMVRRSETIDLNITLEQALQFMVSCGVVTPVDQLSQVQVDREGARLATTSLTGPNINP